MDNSYILLVDDDTALLQALPQAIALRMQHTSVDISDSAQGALQQAQERDYDAIVSDIKMPGMDGLALIEQLQTIRPDTPTLLITGHGERDLAIQALRVGAYDFIQKPIDRDYFITALRRAINTRQMRRQIAEQQEALARYTSSLEQAVTERTRELVEANATKDVFMSMASHELRTPLTTLKGIAQMLVRRAERHEPIEPRTLSLLEHSVHRMEILVNDLLNTSLDDAGLFSLHYQTSDLVELCQEVVDEYREQIGPSLRFESTLPELQLEMDRERISQVLLNLLSNARKYSPKDAPIIMRVERVNDQAAISVTDHGVGIPPEKLAHIFDRFYRVPEIEIQTGSSAGFGLGLYIARKIIELHHGNMNVTSHPGDGSTFTITLPLQRPHERTGQDSGTRTPLFHSAHSAARPESADA